MLRLLRLLSRDQFAWCLYDWGNSAFAVTAIAAILPIYFADVAARDLAPNLRTAYWGYGTAFAIALTVVTAPILGAVADRRPLKKRLLGWFAALGACATAGLAAVGPGDWVLCLVLYSIATIGFSGSIVFYESLLPHLAARAELDRVSLWGYSLGYLGGGVLLAMNVLWIQHPAWFGFVDTLVATRAALASAGVWWLVFTVPVLLMVPEPPLAASASRHEGTAWQSAWATARAIVGQRNLLMFLVAYWVYSDAVGTIIKMAVVYGREIGIGRGDLIGALLMVQLVGFPATLMAVPLARRIGAQRGVLLALMVYVGICVLGYQMTTAREFWLLAALLALVQGSVQALSRSLFASLIPAEKSAEYFAFYSVSSKVAGLLGPLVFALTAQLTGGSRGAILGLLAMFVVGFAILRKVKV